MKKLDLSSLLILAVAGLSFSACQQDIIPDAVVSSVSFYHPSRTKTDSMVIEATVNKPLTIKVSTDGDLCTAWPAGDRLTLKSRQNSAQDSMDVYKNVVLVRSDDFKDYGLVGARGKMMSGSNRSGFSLVYTYTKPGTYEVVLIATKHGQSTGEYKNLILSQKLIVR